MMFNGKVAVDTSVLVALINPNDMWRNQATLLQAALMANGVELFYFDCVVTEAISTAIRRLYEKKRTTEILTLLNRVTTQVPTSTITWVSLDIQRLYPDVLDLMRASGGTLNFNDALIALACRERVIPAIASFDADFDTVSWLHRLATPDDVTRISP